jgi:hypothetical protein
VTVSAAQDHVSLIGAPHPFPPLEIEGSCAKTVIHASDNHRYPAGENEGVGIHILPQAMLLFWKIRLN